MVVAHRVCNWEKDRAVSHHHYITLLFDWGAVAHICSPCCLKIYPWPTILSASSQKGPPALNCCVLVCSGGHPHRN